MADVDDIESSSSSVQQLPETWSRCITESVTATLYLEVYSYQKFVGRENHEYIKSARSRIGGYDWEIRLYPHEHVDALDNRYASAYLYCAAGVKSARASFTFNVMKRDQGQVQAITNFDYPMDRVFSPPKCEWGYSDLVTKTELKSLSRLGDGSFTVRCDLTVINDSPPLELPGHLERMLTDGRGMDVTFDVAGQTIRAHGFMLAACSPVFYRQLFGPMKEKDTRRVEVPDMEPGIFEMLLRFIYTESLPSSSSGDGERQGALVMQHLFVAADRYGVEKLKLICEEELCKMIDVQTVATTLVLADQHHCKGLKDACLEFMSSPGVLDAVMATDGFEHLMETSPDLAPKESFGNKLSVEGDFSHGIYGRNCTHKRRCVCNRQRRRRPRRGWTMKNPRNMSRKKRRIAKKTKMRWAGISVRR